MFPETHAARAARRWMSTGGKTSVMAKIVIIGAGSGFGSRLSLDVMATEALGGATIGLCDIHPGRLRRVTDYVRHTAERHNIPVTIEANTDRTVLLPGADFVITSISAGGGAYWGHPYTAEVGIPRQYGIDQQVADTCSVGAVFRFLRTGPIQRQILEDVERRCPDALVLNHTNPMAMLTWLHHATTSVRNVGLCHGVQGTIWELSEKFLGVPVGEVSYTVAGINHLAWFLEIMRGKEDLYPRLREVVEHPDRAADPEYVARERVRVEIMKHFGYFPTESSRHDSEYMPYFARTPEQRESFGLKAREISDTCPKNREWMGDGGAVAEGAGELRRSNEYTTRIMEAVVTDVPFRFNGNVMNTGLIDNLPQGCCVEVPCMVDARGVHPCHVAPLPAQLAALDRANIAVQELAVQAVLERDREAAFHACALCPLASALLPLDKIRAMFEEMWEAEKELLLWFDPNHRGSLPETCAS